MLRWLRARVSHVELMWLVIGGFDRAVQVIELRPRREKALSFLALHPIAIGVNESCNRVRIPFVIGGINPESYHRRDTYPPYQSDQTPPRAPEGFNNYLSRRGLPIMPDDDVGKERSEQNYKCDRAEDN